MSFRISVFAALGLLATFSACSESETLPFTQYGEALTITETTAIADILADPEAYVGEQLRVEGTVVEVCQQMGCWMAVTAENSVDPLRVKVEDGVIVFPQTAVGHHARVEGTMEKIELTEEQALAQAELTKGGRTLRADVLMLPHHGSWSESLPGFVSAVAPEIVLVSRLREPPGAGGADDAAGRFYAEMKRARRWYSTPRHGWIRVRFGRGRVSVRTMRP